MSAEANSDNIPHLALPAPPYWSVFNEYRSNRRRSATEGAVVEIDGLSTDDSVYNLSAIVFNNRLSLLARFESTDPEDEQSTVRQLDLKGSVATPNGLEIPNSQDPFSAFYNAYDIGIGFVQTKQNPLDPKLVNYRTCIYHLIDERRVDPSALAVGPYKEKDARFNYVGDGNLVIATRERREVGEQVESYLQVGLVPAVNRLDQLTNHIAAVRQNPYSRVEVFSHDPDLWLGPNQVIPLESPDGKIHVGIFFHTGRWINPYYSGQLRNREYASGVVELVFDAALGRFVRTTNPKIIASSEEAPRGIGPAKRPDLERVFFGGSCVFVVDQLGEREVNQTLVFGGWGDSKPAIIRRKGSPFTRPIDLQLNRLSVISERELPNFFN